MLSTITFIIVLSVLILVHELGHFVFAKRFGVRVETFSLGFGRKILGFKRKGTEYRVSAVPLGGYVKMAGESPYEKTLKGIKDEFSSKAIYQRAVILTAGPALNYILGFLLFVFIFSFGTPQITSRVGTLMDGYPAKAAGIKEGDVIVQLNAKPIMYWEEVLDVVHKTTQGSVNLKIKRQDKELSFVLAPKVRELKNVFGQTVKVGLLGIMPSGEVKYVRYNPLKAVYLAGIKTWNVTWITYLSLWRMATGAISLKESITGPIGIFMVTAKAASTGFAYVIGLMAILSISLGIFNLLPIPVLDGGYILFLIIEKIRGKPVSQKAYEWIMQLGLALLIILTAFVVYNDAAKAGWVNKILALIRR